MIIKASQTYVRTLFSVLVEEEYLPEMLYILSSVYYATFLLFLLHKCKMQNVNK